MTRCEVRKIDQWAIETIGLAGVVLMENAGRGAADVAARMLDPTDGARVAVLAGAGNNGGDGFVVARLLRLRGRHVDVFLLAPRCKIGGDARINLCVLERLGHSVIDFTDASIEQMTARWRLFDLLIDGIGGTGIVGDLRGHLASAVVAANGSGAPILALDIPTGMNCDTGRPQGETIRATETVTFVAGKVGFDVPGAAAYTGAVTVADIGVGPTAP